MPKIEEAYRQALAEGKPLGVLSGDIRLLLSHAMGYPAPIDTLYHAADECTAYDAFRQDFAKLLRGVPVEYIIHEAKFLQNKLYVDERVLIPRGETEELVALLSEKIYDYYDPRNWLVVADIGTGSGAIACALKSMYANWLVSASDVSKEALGVAKRNFADLGLSVNVLEGPSLQPYIAANMNLDVIVANPPYILNRDEVQESVKDYEPGLALYLDKERSVYEEIFRDYKKVKKGSLLMAFEIGYDLVDYLSDLMKAYLQDYEYEFVNDLNGLTRFLFVYCH